MPELFGSPDDVVIRPSPARPVPQPQLFGNPQDVVVQPPSSREPPAAASQGKVYYNEAGQPFTLSGKPVPQPAPQDPPGYTAQMPFLPLRRDESGLHPAVPESIAAPWRGMVKGGMRARGVGEAGKDPTRPLDPETTGAVTSLIGSPLAGMADRGMLGPSTLAPGGRLTEPPPRPPKLEMTNEERFNLAKEARERFKIPLSATQMSESGFAKVAESASGRLPLSGAAAQTDAVRKGFNRAVADTFGETADRITPGVMKRAKTRIGGEIDRIENASEIDLSLPAAQGGRVADLVLRDLADIEQGAHAALTAEEFAVVKRLLDGTIRNVMPGDKIAGTTYGALLRKGSPLDQAANNQNSNISHRAEQIAEVMRNALQASLSPEEMAKYSLARFQYKNMKTVEPLVNKSPDGNVSPLLLNNRVSQQFKDRAYQVGDNPLDRLGKIGQAFLKEPPSSGTAERASYLAALKAVGEAIAVVGGGAALAVTHPAAVVPTATAIAATLGLNRVIGSFLRSQRRAEASLRPGEVMPPLNWPYPASVAAAPGAVNAAGDISSYVTPGVEAFFSTSPLL